MDPMHRLCARLVFAVFAAGALLLALALALAAGAIPAPVASAGVLAALGLVPLAAMRLPRRGAGSGIARDRTRRIRPP